ncbi:MAG: Do family serine endopeptidase, partial [Paracoccaceae bacterium]
MPTNVVRSRHPIRAALMVTALAVLPAFATLPAFADVPPAGYADLVARISPEVVFIEVTGKDTRQMTEGGDNPMGQGSPFDEFMKRFGQPDQGQGQGQNQPDAPNGGIMRALGSGFLISASGEIVTNNHVVDGASSIKVRLQDGREFKAHVVGSDKLTDVALIKLDKAKDMPFAAFPPTDTLRVGDAVVAIGNPFGLGGSVTSGIVSAVGRDINSGPYDNFIQTDAAINKGNSGGPLFNTAGEVVGMNTAIYSPSGGSVGIGFAVPAKTIENVVAQLRDKGSVARGWLGVAIQPVTPDLAQALGLDTPGGAVVASVQPDSPASAAKLQSGDVILAVNGDKVDTIHGLPTLIANIAAGKTADLSVLRDGKTDTMSVTIGKLTPEKLQLASAPGNDTGSSTDTQLGATVEMLTPDMANGLGLPQDTKGVVVSKVAPDSPNADRLQAGDIVLEVEGHTVTTPADVNKLVAAAKDKGAVLIKLSRGGAPMF